MKSSRAINEDFGPCIILAFRNHICKILADFKILAFQNAKVKILPFQNPEFKILTDFKILAFHNPEFKILADLRILESRNVEVRQKFEFKI